MDVKKTKALASKRSIKYRNVLHLQNATTTTITVLRPLYRSICVSRHLQEDFVGAKFYCSHALADSNQHIWIREKMLEFSSTVLSTMSLCHFQNAN